MPDHIHILIGQRPDRTLSELVGDLKSGSTNFINRKRWVGGRFNWQEAFGAFSYSHSQLSTVITVLPQSLVVELQHQLAKVKLLHEGDLREGYGEVFLPGALGTKYPAAAREWHWQYLHLFATHLLEDRYGIRTIQELLGHNNVQTTMIYTHVLNRGGRGVRSPLDG